MLILADGARGVGKTELSAQENSLEGQFELCSRIFLASSPGRTSFGIRKMTGMKHRDRVMMALSHDEPDRCPLRVSFASEFASRLTTPGRSGGLILAPTHHVQPDTSMENFWAAVQTVTSTSYGGLKG